MPDLIEISEVKNFGYANSGVNDDGEITQKFNFCFFKLSNGRIIQVMEVENFDAYGSPIGNSLHVTNEPRFDFNGTLEDFWKAQWTYDSVKYDFTDPTEEESEVVLNYYKSMNSNGASK